MDIVKQLRFIFILLGLALIALPVLDRYYNITPEEVLYKAIPSTRPGTGELDEESAQKMFEIIKDDSVPHTEDPGGVQPNTVGLFDLNAQDEVNAQMKQAEDVKALGQVVEKLENTARPSSKKEKTKSKWIAPPMGFQTRSTYNFLVYRENKDITEKVEKVLEHIHGNLMLDLVPFTLVKTPDKSLVVLFTEQNSYTDFTKRPSWSGAACDVPRETLYVLEQGGFYPLSIHEMTHLYFDGFFDPKRMPLWISEGLATYMQVRASGQVPSWVTRAMARLKAGDVIDLDTMASTRTLNDMPSDYVELWYTQAYSIVDYLLNKRTRDEFYAFCLGIADGKEQTAAMYRAYGLPFTQFGTLQNVWMHDMLGLNNGGADDDDGLPPPSNQNIGRRPGANNGK